MQVPPDSRPPQSASPGMSWAQAYVEASLTLAHASDPVDLLRTLVRFAGAGFTSARLGLIDASAPTRARVIAEAEGSAVRAADYPERITDYPGWDTLGNRELLVLNDILALSTLNSEQRDRLRARRIGSVALIPLVADGELAGVLILSSPGPLEVDNVRMRALRVLVDQVARTLVARQMQDALAGARARATRSARQLDAVTRLALRAGSFENGQALYEFAVRELVQLLNADHGGVLVLDADEVAGTVVAEYPASGALGSRLTMAGNELFDMVRAQGGAPVIANHVADDPRLLPDTRVVFQQIGLRSIMFIPVVQGGRIVSSIGMDLFTDDREFDQDMAETAQAIAAQVSGTLENIGRAEQLARQLHAVETMSTLATSIYRLQEDEHALFESIGAEVARATASDHLAFILIQPDGQTGVIASEYPSRGMAGVKMELATSVVAGPLRQLQAGAEGPLTLTDLQRIPRLSEQARAMIQQYDVRAMMVAPLNVDGRLTGVLALDRSTAQRPYEPEILAVARTLSAELSIGLQNIRLVKDARRRAAQLEHITEFTRAAQTSEAIEGVLDSAISTVRQITPSDRIGVLFFEEDRRELRLVARYQEGVSSVSLHDGPLVSLTGSYAGQVWTTQTPLAVQDALVGAANRPRGDADIRSMLLYPFNAGAALRGVLSIGSGLPRAYSDSDAAVLQQMVNQLAAALESRSTLAARQIAAEQEALINTLSARYQRAVDVEDMLTATLRELSDHFGAKRGRIRLALEAAPIVERPDESKPGMEVW